MNKTQLREELIFQADVAFLALAKNLNELLDAAQAYADVTLNNSKSANFKLAELKMAVMEMAKHLKFLGYVVEGWKKEEERVISRLGIEVSCLNELKTTIEATWMFLEREKIQFSSFSMGAVNQAHAELVRCNRLL